jgi:hypothetical protein
VFDWKTQLDSISIEDTEMRLGSYLPELQELLNMTTYEMSLFRT